MKKAIEINQLSLSYGDKPLLTHLNLSIYPRQWLAILGRSGCGKSTLLKAIANLDQGIEKPSGHIQVNGKIAYMAQQDGLMPWLSVRDNVQLQHYLTGSKSADSARRALQLLARVGLANQADKAPYELSGGQRQRVALARTLMQTADIILMDEPFSAVDAITRLELQQLSAQLLADKTVVLITHDPGEAIKLADNIVVMRDGQLGKPYKIAEQRPRFAANQTHVDLQQQLLGAL
ncbi:MAG: phosphonate ABC transporter ATP-binding protein [Gammaproteobacteria bacterium]|nr:MAG: phosphonate ABC transporter ATP-binding protein [Gammaproteobacteria bacterium]